MDKYEDDRLLDRLAANKRTYEMEVEYNKTKAIELKAMELSDIEAMLLNHEQQIKDIAAHLLELRAWGTPMMEFKREQPTKIVGPNLVGVLNAAGFYQKREWQSLTDDEIKEIVGSYSGPIKGYTRELFDKIETKLKEKNGG